MSLTPPHHRHEKGERGKGDTARFAEELAPLEEQGKTQSQQDEEEPGVNHEEGAIVLDSKAMNLPRGMESEPKAKEGIEPVVLIILALMIGYIVFIAWQIAQMPTP